jgi:2-keto-4-pentenoate hydratase/2-oxohepta-3-ene-1,7-dioic acid hydratase in catechol pathway
MRLVRYTHSGNGSTWGVLEGSTVHSLATHSEGEPAVADLASEGYLASVAAAVERGGLSTVPAAEVDLLAPVPRPGKIVAVGLNYRDHAEEQGADIPESPILFSKAPTAVTHPGSPVVLPEDEEKVDYEAELGVVVGATARRVDREEAPGYVAGYTAINDVSGRDAQFDDGQFFRGKSYDTFAPMGPTIVPDHALDPNALDVACRVNGETKQSSNTEEFIFDVGEMIEYISHVMTLRPGDVISTGTPGGVGIFRDPPELLEAGDEVEVEIEGIGTLSNPVVDG